MDPVSCKIEEQEFLALRKEVLGMWPSGQDVDLEEAIAYHKKIGESKNTAAALQAAHQEGRTLCALRAGFPTVEEQIEHLQWVEKAGADLLPVTADSYTRNLRFKEIDGLLRDADHGGAKINDFPAVNYGVRKCRQITTAVNHPITLKHGSIDPRLLAEIAFAGGFSDLNGNVFSWGLTYTKITSGSDHGQSAVRRPPGWILFRAGRHHCTRTGWRSGTGLLPIALHFIVQDDSGGADSRRAR